MSSRPCFTCGTVGDHRCPAVCSFEEWVDFANGVSIPCPSCGLFTYIDRADVSDYAVVDDCCESCGEGFRLRLDGWILAQEAYDRRRAAESIDQGSDWSKSREDFRESESR